MKYLIKILFITIFLANVSLAQIPDIINNSKKIKPNEVDSAINVINKYLEKEKNKDNINKAYLALGDIYFKKNQYQKAITYHQKALSYYQDKEQSGKVADVNYSLSISYYLLGAYNKALDYAFTAIDLYEKNNKQKKLYRTYNTIGLIYKQLKNYEFSKKYYYKALNYSIKAKDSLMLGALYNNIGEILLHQGKNDSAKIYFNKSIKIKRLTDDEFSIVYPFGNLGNLAENEKRYKDALNYFKKIVYLSERYNNISTKALAYYNIAVIYARQGYNDLAYSYFKKAYELSEKTLNKKLMSEIYKGLADYFYNTNKPDSAVIYLKHYIIIKDSLINEDLNKKISQLQVAYDIENQQKENRILKKINKLKEQRIKQAEKAKYYYIGISILSVLLILLLLNRYKYRKKYTEIIEQKAKEIDEVNKKLQHLNSILENKVKEKTHELHVEIDERKQIERELQNLLYRERQISKQKSKFLTKISSEIRTPLNAISGLATLLQKKFAGSADKVINDYVKGIKDNSERLLNLLNNIIDFNKIQTNEITLNYEKLNLAELIMKVIQLHQFNINDKKIELKINIDENITLVSDKIYLSKVINEIIDNSIKFTENGTISIATIEQSNSVIIKITDTGIGIEQSKLSGIFSQFEQINTNTYDYSKVGIGLPFIKKVVNLLNGNIEISSKPGKGTRVTLYIPKNNAGIVDEKSQNFNNLLSDHIVKQKAFQIFLLEDDYFNKLMLETTLNRIGEVTSASSGNEALQLIEQKHNKGEEFDIMIIDINLPDGWDGIKLMKTIKDKWPLYKDIIFIAQTAYTEEEDKRKIIEAGFNEYITKPIDPEYLINIVKRRLIS